MPYRPYILLLTIFLIYSCSEGDIIEDDIIDFDSILEHCSNEDNNTFVFYKTSIEPNRALSVSFGSTTFNITPTIADISIVTPTEIALNSSTNLLIYREFNRSIADVNYFCNSIPPSGIDINEQLASTNGTLLISYSLIEGNMYTRTITLQDITLEGNGTVIRRELLLLGSDTLEIN